MKNFLLFAARFTGAFTGVMIVAFVLCAAWFFILSFIMGDWLIDYKLGFILLKCSIIISFLTGIHAAIKNDNND